jgi:hypothetical protein
MNMKIAIHSSLTMQTSTDLVGKLPEWLQLVLVPSAVHHLHQVTLNSHAAANAGAK